MTHVTCRLTAENRDQLRNPTLGNRVWATVFTVFELYVVNVVIRCRPTDEELTGSFANVFQ